MIKIYYVNNRRMTMGRFEECGDEVIDIVEDVKNDVFPSLRSAKVKILFDTKKRMSGGKLVIGRMQKTNDLLRHLTVDESNSDDGFDYILYIDKNVWTNVSSDDKIRIARRQLQHCDVDMDANANPYKLRGFETEDFYDEIEYNKDDPRWYDRCVEVGLSIYDRD